MNKSYSSPDDKRELELIAASPKYTDTCLEGIAMPGITTHSHAWLCDLHVWSGGKVFFPEAEIQVLPVRNGNLSHLFHQTKDVTTAMNEGRFDEALKLRGR